MAITKTVSSVALGILLIAVGCNKPQSLPRTESAPAPSEESASILPEPERHAVVKLTPEAVAKIREVQKQEHKPYLRVAVKNGGSTGFQYDLEFDDKYDAESDYLDETDGIQTVVDKRSSIYLDGATMNWTTNSDGQQGFKFDNPNAVKQ